MSYTVQAAPVSINVWTLMYQPGVRNQGRQNGQVFTQAQCFSAERRQSLDGQHCKRLRRLRFSLGIGAVRPAHGTERCINRAWLSQSPLFPQTRADALNLGLALVERRLARVHRVVAHHQLVRMLHG